MNIIIFILIVAMAAVTAILISQMQVQINKLSAMTEENSGRIFEIHALEQNNETRIKKIGNATHAEVQRTWADTDETIRRLEKVTEDIRRLDELEADTRQNLLTVAEQVRKNKENVEEAIRQTTDISHYYCNYITKGIADGKDKDNE